LLLDLNPELRSQAEFSIPAGRAGVIQTLRMMRGLVKHYKKNAAIRNRALELVNFAADKDYVGEIERVFRFVRDEIRYTLDINGVETLQTPEATLAIGHGDCDDKATLLAALLEASGHHTRFHAIGLAPGELSHVFVETLIGDNEWIALDPTELDAEVGWTPDGPDVRDRAIIYN
jgi:transglutaminase-like putative cysteine protease